MKFYLPFLFTYGVSLMLISLAYHNIDISYNMLKLEKFEGVKLVDKSIFGIEQTSMEVYSSGIKTLFIGIFINLISVSGIVINILLTK